MYEGARRLTFSPVTPTGTVEEHDASGSLVLCADRVCRAQLSRRVHRVFKSACVRGV